MRALTTLALGALALSAGAPAAARASASRGARPPKPSASTASTMAVLIEGGGLLVSPLFWTRESLNLSWFYGGSTRTDSPDTDAD